MQEMDCEHWREYASDYIENTLSADKTARMSQHAASCAECAKADAALRTLYREMHLLPEVEPPLFFRENVIAAIEREAREKPGAWWDFAGKWQRLGRVGIGAALATGAAFALVWGILLPRTTPPTTAQTADVLGHAPKPVAPVVTVAPRLHLTRVLTMTAQDGPSYDIQVWLTSEAGASSSTSNTSDGTVRFQVEGDERDYRLPLHFNQAETLRIPLSVATGRSVLGLTAVWSAGGEMHTRHLYVPLLTSDKAIPPRQSFGLSDLSALDAGREIAARFQMPVVLDDVPDTQRVQINARQETALETLTRHLQPSGYAVTSGTDGIEIAPVAAPTVKSVP